MLMLSACGGVLTWKTVYSSRSPNANGEIRLEETGCFADCTVQVVVSKGWHTTTLITKSACAVMFAHAIRVGSVAAVFVDGSYCGDIRVAYDISVGRAVDFKIVEQKLKEAIVREYGVTPEEIHVRGDDVLKWATYPGRCCSRAVDEFRTCYLH
jgi:hypothetical protein